MVEIDAAGKGVIPYEKNITLNSLDSVPENNFFFEISEFYRELKQSHVSEIEYENSKFSYQTLKMRNFSDMNDLNNFENTCFFAKLLKIGLKRCIKCTILICEDAIWLVL